MPKQLRKSIGTHKREEGACVKVMIAPYEFNWLPCNKTICLRRNGKHIVADLSVASYGEMVWDIEGDYLGIVSSELTNSFSRASKEQK